MTLRFWPFHRHRWRAIRRSNPLFPGRGDRIWTYRCPCGRSKIRLH